MAGFAVPALSGEEIGNMAAGVACPGPEEAFVDMAANIARHWSGERAEDMVAHMAYHSARRLVEELAAGIACHLLGEPLGGSAAKVVGHYSLVVLAYMAAGMPREDPKKLPAALRSYPQGYLPCMRPADTWA